MTVKQIQKQIEDYFDIDLTKRGRQYEKIKYRFMYYHYSYNFSSEITSLEKIGKSIGGYDHSTVLHGMREFHNILLTDHKFKENINAFDNDILPLILKSKRIKISLKHDLALKYHITGRINALKQKLKEHENNLEN